MIGNWKKKMKFLKWNMQKKKKKKTFALAFAVGMIIFNCY